MPLTEVQKAAAVAFYQDGKSFTEINELLDLKAKSPMVSKYIKSLNLEEVQKTGAVAEETTPQETTEEQPLSPDWQRASEETGKVLNSHNIPPQRVVEIIQDVLDNTDLDNEVATSENLLNLIKSNHEKDLMSRGSTGAVAMTQIQSEKTSGGSSRSNNDNNPFIFNTKNVKKI